MTSLFEKLQQSPQTGINIGTLAPEERQVVRRIQVKGTTGYQDTNRKGRFTGVFYVEGDEREAVKLFVEENRERLETVDFSKRNVIQTSVSRNIYDWILHEAGHRVIEKYDTVVREERPDGGVWYIDRDEYEQHHNRRYNTQGAGSAYSPPQISLKEVYEETEVLITEDTLRSAGIEGDVRQVLDYLRLSDGFNCVPDTAGDQLAIRKVNKSEQSVSS